MKRLILFALCSALILALAGCGSLPASHKPDVVTDTAADYVPLYAFTGRQDFISQLRSGENFPVSMEVCADMMFEKTVTVTDPDFIAYAAEELGKVKVGNKSNVCVEDATARYVSFYMADGSEICFSFYYEFFSFGGADYEMDNGGMKLWKLADVDAEEVRAFYGDVASWILSDMEESIPSDSLDFYRSLSRGCIGDYLGRGAEQLLFAYTPDGKTLVAGMFATDAEGSFTGDTVQLYPLAGCASCELICGRYLGSSAVFVLYENCEGDMPVYELSAFDMSGDVPQPVFTRELDGRDSLSALGEEGIILGETVCAFGETGTGTALAELCS